MSLTSYRAAPPRGEGFGSGAAGVGQLDPERVPSVSSRSRRRNSLSIEARPRARTTPAGSRPGRLGAAHDLVGCPVELEAPERVGDRGSRLGDDGCTVEETKIGKRRKDELSDALGRPGSDLLSRVLRRSTIGAEGFHGRVRNGNGLGPLARTTRPAKSIREL